MFTHLEYRERGHEEPDDDELEQRRQEDPAEATHAQHHHAEVERQVATKRDEQSEGKEQASAEGQRTAQHGQKKFGRENPVAKIDRSDRFHDLRKGHTRSLCRRYREPN